MHQIETTISEVVTAAAPENAATSNRDDGVPPSLSEQEALRTGTKPKPTSRDVNRA